MRAVARAHRRTGIPIITHTGPPAMGAEQQRIFVDEGVALRDNVVIGHVGDTDDVGYLKRLADQGNFLGMDLFGLDERLPFKQRVATVARLCADGYADRLVLAHDCSCLLDWIPDFLNSAPVQRPNWNMAHISRDVLPALLAAGVSQSQMDQVLMANPRRLLEPAAPY